MKFLTLLRACTSLSAVIGSTCNHVKMRGKHVQHQDAALTRQDPHGVGVVSQNLLALLLIAFGLTATACGNSLYLVQVNRAERSFQEAKELDAEHLAPYEYYSAKVRLEEARRQAAEAEYSNAADLSDEATDFSNQAILLSKKAREQSSSAETSK